VLSLFLAAILLVILAPKSAVNVDEQLHYPHAQKVVNWYFTAGADDSCLHTPVTNLKYYGQSVDNFTALVNRIFGIENEFLTRHFTGAFFFWLILVFAGFIGYDLTASYGVSALTVIMILAMPRLFGQAFGNLKDIPFAAGYLASVFMIVRFVKELPMPKWSTVILLGLAIAFTNSVRIGGLILFAYFVLALAVFIILKPFLLKQIFSTKLSLVRLMGQGVVILLIGYFGGLLFWPFALQNVLVHPLESLQVMEYYKVSIRQVFNGQWLWSTQLPWYYLPQWLFISIPEYIYFGFGVFLILFFRNFLKRSGKQLYFELFLLFTLFFPLVYVMVIKANLYSGVRQMLFVFPVLAVFSAMGIVNLIQNLKTTIQKKTVVLITLVLIIFPVFHQIQTFPADYIYFNAVSGGNGKAWSNMEYDYYFHGFKKPAEYLIEKLDGKKAIVAANCNLSNYFENHSNIEYRYTRYLERSSEDWDYGLFGVNYLHPELLKNGNWKSTQITETFYHKGNPVVLLLKRENKNDLLGIQKIKTGNFSEGEALLEKEIVSDKNNVWLYVELAKSSLNRKDSESFNRYLHRGREIYPQYEPFYLLEAQALYTAGEFGEAKKVLNSLAEVNPRYGNASALLQAVDKKLKKK
jgi:tetratricopeptide (TPR) repeat protein